MNARVRWLLAALAVAITTAVPPALRAGGALLGDASVLALRLQVWSQTLARVGARFDLKELRS